jgi:hypothetical protein
MSEDLKNSPRIPEDETCLIRNSMGILATDKPKLNQRRALQQEVT